MKIGAIVICRYNSSRLPGKILKKINGKPILTYIIERLKCVQNLDDFEFSKPHFGQMLLNDSSLLFLVFLSTITFLKFS